MALQRQGTIGFIAANARVGIVKESSEHTVVGTGSHNCLYFLCGFCRNRPASNVSNRKLPLLGDVYSTRELFISSSVVEC